MSSRLSRSSEAFASELLENLKEINRNNIIIVTSEEKHVFLPQENGI